MRGSSDRSGSFGFDRETAIGSAFGDGTLENKYPPRIVVPYFGNCTQPIGLASSLGRDVQLGVRCRRCPGCLRARRYLWKLRAECEVLQSAQSYLFTGTYRDQYHDLAPVALSITLWLKRLRERVDGASVRYLVATERHKSGAWHMHALLHDVNGDAGQLGLMSEVAWRDGWSNCKRVNVFGAGYVTKYVSKDLDDFGSSGMRPRIRASRSPRYGDAVMAHEDEIVRELQRRKVDLGQVHNVNLREILKFATKKDDAWKNLINSAQTNGRLLLSTEEDEVLTYREVDRETGEIRKTR